MGDKEDPDFILDYDSNKNCFWSGNIKVEFVHELQHVLRLHGFTDMADNFNLL